MPFCKVPAPTYHQYGSVAKALTAPTHSNDVVSNGAGARRIRAPLRHSVDSAPPLTTGLSSTKTRQHFRSSYADPAVANGADPYVKTSSRDLTNDGCSNRSVAVRAMASSLRPETARLISNSSIDSCSTDSGRPASAGSSVVRQMACQIELHSDVSSTLTAPTTPPPDIVNRKSRDRPEEIGVASEAIRVAIYRSSRAGWTREQSAHRFWSHNDSKDDATPQVLPPTGNGASDGVVKSGVVVVNESLIAREIREQREREEELMRQRRVSICGSIGDGEVIAGHFDDIDGPTVAADSSDFDGSRHVSSHESVDRDVISPSILGKRSPTIVTKTSDRLVPVLARYQPTQPTRAAMPCDQEHRRLLQERGQHTKKLARTALLSYLPTSCADNTKPLSTTPDVRNGFATKNGIRAVSPVRPQLLSRPPSASINEEPGIASKTVNGNHPEAARNGHDTHGGVVVVGGGIGGGVESTMRKLASSRMHMELARDRQREQDVNDEKTASHRRTPTPNSGASCGRFGGGGVVAGCGRSSKTPTKLTTDESKTKSCGYIQQSSQRTKTKQIASSGHHRVAFCDEVDVAKSPICGQVLTSVRSSFIEKEINDLRNREEELRRQRESSFNSLK